MKWYQSIDIINKTAIKARYLVSILILQGVKVVQQFENILIEQCY
jgi:hypothetical protein